MALRKHIAAIDEKRILLATEIQMPTVTAHDRRYTARHPFRRREVKPLASARQNESISRMVEEIHLQLIELF